MTEFGDRMRKQKAKLEEAEGRSVDWKEFGEDSIQQTLHWENFNRYGDKSLDKMGAKSCKFFILCL